MFCFLAVVRFHYKLKLNTIQRLKKNVNAGGKTGGKNSIS